MNHLKTVSRHEVSDTQWDEWVGELSDSHWLHSAAMLRYYDAFDPGGPADRSFAVFDASGQLVAVCPFRVSHREEAGRPMVEATFCGTPCGQPSLKFGPPNERRRVAREVFGLIDEQCRSQGVQRIVLRKPATSIRTQTDPHPIYALEAQENGYQGFAQSVLVVDLRKSQDELLALMTSEQRKHIRQTMRKGVSVRVRCGETSATAELDAYFAAYRHAHFLSAGRNTRPEKTWELMREYLETGMATLFVASAGEAPISFLYCGEFHGIAFGWSQVNREEYEKQYSPRHLIEWFAINHYRARGLAFYEIGERFKCPSLWHTPTAKEITIATLKERFGGEPWPEYVFEKYYDLGLQDDVYARRYAALRTELARVTGQAGRVAGSTPRDTATTG